MMGRTTIILMVTMLFAQGALAASNISNTRHNLSPEGPGTVKSSTIGEVCIFCHTPHHAATQAPLWNRTLPSGQTYQLYGSTTLQATPEDPQLRSGNPSLLCLSCHDGTIALGDFANPSQEDPSFTFQSGDRGLLGTDFRDDHPFSFVYDSALATADPLLKDPGAGGVNLAPLPLASGGYVECTTCHDVHDNTIPPFLHVSTLNGEVCLKCHEAGLTGLNFTGSIHQTSTTSVTAANLGRRAEWPGATVAEVSCLNCHTPHNAGSAARLLRGAEEGTCFNCHDGTVATKDISGEFAKSYRHPVDVTPNPNHDMERLEDPLTMTLHAECPDCHNPHTVGNGGTVFPMFTPIGLTAPPVNTTAPNANSLITGVQGITQAGTVTQNIQYQYELCYKCHGVPGKGPCPGSADPLGAERCSTVVTAGMDKRVDGIYNIREKVDPSGSPVSIPGDPGTAGISYHPIVQNNPGNESVPSLVDLAFTGQIYCTDCHNSNASVVGDTPGVPDPINGPHGSEDQIVGTRTHQALLANYYDFSIDANPAANNHFAVCYRCHDEASIENDDTGFPHNAHINARGGGCILCHDPHGSRFRERLINFWWADRPNDNAGVDCESRITDMGQELACDYSVDGFSPRWDHNTGGNHGSCLLECHGTVHSFKSY